MPRERSAKTPPPRRSTGTERSRSVRRLTHPLKRRSAIVHEEVEQPIFPLQEPVADEQHDQQVSEHQPATSDDFKQQLIQKHAAVRATRSRSSLGAGGIAGVVVTCLVIFLGWWLVAKVFAKTPAAPVVTPVATSTVHFLPIVVSSSTTPVVGSADAVATSTATTTPATIQRKLLLPLKPASSTKRLP